MDTNPKTQYGLAKPGLDNVPPTPLFSIGLVMSIGAKKYGPMNWRKDPVSASTYYNGMLRHAMSWWDGQELDRETLCHELAHAAANIIILLDALETGNLIDDRPLAGNTTYYISAHTKPIEKES
jgi:hypothetical protein